MGLFDSTIDTLSKLAINESSVNIPEVTSPALVDEFISELKMMPALTEEEIRFPVEAVPLKENSRLGKYLIEIEDLSRYMLTNKISNVLEAVHRIGAINMKDLDNRNTAIVVDEASILQEIEDLGMNIGGANSNEGNIGTVGLLGRHDDINKFRRFANSREFVDIVSNKYGLPIVKKNYTIGLVPPKRGDIYHHGNVQEDTDIVPKPGNQVLNEKPNQLKKKTKLTYFGEEGPSSNPSPTSTPPKSDNMSPAFKSYVDRYNAGTPEQQKNAGIDWDNDSGTVVDAKLTNAGLSKHGVHEDSNLQYLRDLAYGKYDKELLNEGYGGPRVKSPYSF